MHIKKLTENGIGLVEVILALGISIIVITALVSLSIYTLRSSLNSKLLLNGTKLANAEVEMVRGYRDTVGWATFASDMQNCSSTCYFSSANTLVFGTDGIETVSNGNPAEDIARYFVALDGITNGVVTGTTTIIRINVITSWTVGGVAKYARVSTDLSNWR